MGKPKIRFKGYTDEWEQRKVSDLFKVTRGSVLAATLTEGRQSDEMPYPVYSSQTKDKGLLGYYKDYLYEDAITWTTDGANAGTVNYRAGKFYCTNVCGVLVSNKIKANQMVAEALNNVAKKYVSYVGNPKLMNNVMADIEIQIPIQAEEREQISHFFTILDHLITLHQRKYEQAKTLKKYMLQKMFPQDGMRVPEIRFAGFTDEWEQRKFSDIAQRESLFQTSSYACPSVEYEDVIAEEGCLNKDIRLKEVQKTGIKFDGTQVLYGKLRPYLHNWLNPDFMGIAVGDWWVLRPVKIDKNFLYRLIQTKKFDDVANQSSGSKMPRADWNLVSQSEFIVPTSLEEQCRIAEVFEGLDHLITLHQRKCDELRKIKKYMLQNMFC